MNPIVLTNYDPTYVLVSFVLAMVGSYVALKAATRIKLPDGSISTANALTAGLALGGIGVWAMHFVGMLALNMDLANSYAMIETGVSLVAAVVAASVALAFVARAPEKTSRMLIAGTLLGLSVVVMHYLGMYGMKFGGFIQWNLALVAGSVLIAVVAATAALWLAFNTSTIAKRFAAAVVMAIAVCAMHYIGMAAAEFICTTTNRNAIPQGYGYISEFGIASLVIVATLSMGFLISISMLFQPGGLTGSAPSAKRSAP